MVKQISVEEAFQLKDTIFIDARSPKEYEIDHILGAINIPLLDNEERHEIGIIYKQISQDLAIEKGLGYYSKKIPSIIKIVKPYKDKTLVLYCARGGMRSGIIASLLESIGFKVLQIKGGYKLFRHYILDKLNNFQLKPKVYVLWGLTCTGKTQLLQQFPNSLDLEGLAQHRGSLYGAIGLKPHSQKKFENLLLQRLNELNKKKYIFVECESRKIGNVQMPDFLFKAIMNGANVLITRDLTVRVKEMVKEYFLNPKIVEEIKEITKKLWKVISKKKKQQMLEHLENKEYEQAARILLVDYYDPLYNHSLKKVNYSFEVCNDVLSEAVEKLKKLVG